MSKTNEVDTKGKELFIDINIWDIRHTCGFSFITFYEIVAKEAFLEVRK